MDIGAIFLLLSVCVLIGLFVARPFMEGRRVFSEGSVNQELSSLLAERDRLLGALQELDFDHTLGKIPEQEYPSMRAALLKQASDVLRHLDALQPQANPDDDAESRVEAVIASRRADAAVGPAAALGSLADDDLEELLAARRAQRKEATGGFCPKCGKPVLRSDRFCPSCGKPI